MEQEFKKWDPFKYKGEQFTEDAYRTLFVGRISYETSEKKLKREFEHFGRISKIRMIHDSQGKPRGYAFIEFEKEADLRMAYDRADGKKIDGRRIVVDVERGRTVKGWRPRKFGGGLGGTKRQIGNNDTPNNPTLAVIPSGRDEPRGNERSPRPDRRRRQSRSRSSSRNRRRKDYSREERSRRSRSSSYRRKKRRSRS